jgi:hypothetical protein
LYVVGRGPRARFYQDIHNQFWGYRRCGNYQVVDQDGVAINKVISITEAITTQAHTVDLGTTSGGANSNSSGQVVDTDAFGFVTSPAPVSGQYAVVRLVWSTTVNGSTVYLRVNCMDYEYNDVTMTDSTSSGPTVTCVQQ